MLVSCLMKRREFIKKFGEGGAYLVAVSAVGDLLLTAACGGGGEPGQTSPAPASSVEASPTPALVDEVALAQTIIRHASDPAYSHQRVDRGVVASVLLKGEQQLVLREVSATTKSGGTPDATTVINLVAVLGRQGASEAVVSISLDKTNSGGWAAAWNNHGKTGAADSVKDPERFQQVAKDLDLLTHASPGGEVPALTFPE